MFLALAQRPGHVGCRRSLNLRDQADDEMRRSPARRSDRSCRGIAKAIEEDRPDVLTHPPDQWGRQGHAGRLREAVEGSLRRLRLERIDLYQLARVDSTVPAAEQFGVLAELRKQGKVRHVGLSEVGVDQVQAARKVVPIASVQNRYSLADRAWERVLDYCQAEGIAFLPWFPLGAGRLAEAGGALVQVARRHQATPAQVALAWLLRRSPVMLPIPGTSSVAHLEQNLAASALRLDDDEFQLLDSMDSSRTADSTTEPPMNRTT